jgi:hypothetical protein
MANNLTAAQAAAFAGPTFDHAKIEVDATINKNGLPIGPNIDIRNRVHSFGKCQIQAWIGNPRRSGSLNFPTMSWTLDNHDGYFTPGHNAEVWDGIPPQFWQMRYHAAEFNTNPLIGTPILDLHFDVVEVETEDEIAVVTGVHQLARLLAKRWRHADRRPVDWATHAVTHTFTL